MANLLKAWPKIIEHNERYWAPISAWLSAWSPEALGVKISEEALPLLSIDKANEMLDYIEAKYKKYDHPLDIVNFTRSTINN